MPNATFHFPSGFLWGTSTSAYQVEGNNSNTNWYQWENFPGKIYQNQKAGRACDWWSGKWKEDMDRAVLTHQNSHRLSIEWSRIQPDINRWDEDSLDHYRDILRGLHDRGIHPIITLHHFTEPIWISELGSWENNEIINYFEKYVVKVVEGLKEYCSTWIPINEPNVLAHQAFIEGNFPPGKTSLELSFLALSNMVKAHTVAYSAIKRISPLSRVGTAINYRAFWPKNKNNPFDLWMAKLLHNQFNDAFMNALKLGKFKYALKTQKIPEAINSFDFLGVNFYTGDDVQFNLLRFKELFHQRTYPEMCEVSENGFIANVPKGFEESINWALKYSRPVIITENGIEDSQDLLRPQYLIEHIHKVWRAANLNYQIKGYFHWTLVDNFEWERGWSQRFGLWKLNLENQTRIKTKSADLYSEICKTNSLSSDMVKKFVPSIYSKLFP